MRHTLLRVAIFAAASAAWAPLASAQPETRDHRTPPPPPPPPDTRDHRHPPDPPRPPADDHRGHGAIRVDSIAPGSAKVGATVTVKGDNLPEGAAMLINGKPAATTRVDEHTLTFVVPDLPPGRFDMLLEGRGKRVPVTALEVLPSGSPPIVPPRDHGGPDHGDRDDHGGRDDHGWHRRDWHMDRPVISSYWPAKGDVGTPVVIRGRNFGADTAVVWGTATIAGARVTPTEISFTVPRGAVSGSLALRSSALRRDLPVGAFEVSHFDAAAEWRHQEDERRARAEAAWKERAGQIAKDRAARDAELAKREADLAASREQRRAQRAAAMRAKFQAAFLADPETQSELALHAQRAAALDRMDRLAESIDNGKLAVRIKVAIDKESDRHDQRMAALEASFKTKGGAP